MYKYLINLVWNGIKAAGLKGEVNSIIFLALLAANLFFSGCANVVAPTGGDKDVTSPKLLNSEPKNLHTNFARRKIIFTFDEFVVMKDAQIQVVVSPPMKRQLEFLLKGKSLEITIADSLHENTTYNINFGKSVVDNTEGNLADLPNYVFSTGNFIDSLSVSGTVSDNYTGENIADVLVMLYKSDVDSLPITTTPYYFDRTDGNGSFKITNVSAGKYKIFALLEKNSNYLFDNPEEEQLAFIDSLVIPIWDEIKPDTTQKDTLPPTKEQIAADSLLAIEKFQLDSVKKSQQLKLKMFQEEKEKQGLKKWTYTPGGKLQLIYNRPVEKFSYKAISTLKELTWESTEFSLKRDSIVLWMTDTLTDSLTIAVWADTSKADTLTFSLKTKKKEVTNSNTRGKLKGIGTASNSSLFQIEAGVGGQLDLHKNIVLTTTSPIRFADFTKATLWATGKDSLKMLNFSVVADTLNQRRYSFSHKWKEGTEYHFFIPPGSIENINGKTNDTLKAVFKTKTEADYGTLNFTVFVPGGNSYFLLQLIDEKGKTIQERPLQNGKAQRFVNINPGNYNLRLIDDQNHNGKWDTGKYSTHKQPEKVYIHPSKIEIKANWDMDIDWNIK